MARSTIFECLAEDELRHDGQVLWLTTIGRHDQASEARFRKPGRYRMTNCLALLVDPAEMNRLGVMAGEVVTLETVSVVGAQCRFDDMTLVPHELPMRRCIAYCPGGDPLRPFGAQTHAPALEAIPVQIIRTATGAA